MANFTPVEFVWEHKFYSIERGAENSSGSAHGGNLENATLNNL